MSEEEDDLDVSSFRLSPRRAKDNIYRSFSISETASPEKRKERRSYNGVGDIKVVPEKVYMFFEQKKKESENWNNSEEFRDSEIMRLEQILIDDEKNKKKRGKKYHSFNDHSFVKDKKFHLERELESYFKFKEHKSISSISSRRKNSTNENSDHQYKSPNIKRKYRSKIRNKSFSPNNLSFMKNRKKKGRRKKNNQRVITEERRKTNNNIRRLKKCLRLKDDDEVIDFMLNIDDDEKERLVTSVQDILGRLGKVLDIGRNTDTSAIILDSSFSSELDEFDL